jgi:hypothetical protein
MQVTSTINRTNAQYINYQNEPTSSVRAFQNVVLSQLPGVTFALLTLVYIVASLVRL